MYETCYPPSPPPSPPPPTTIIANKFGTSLSNMEPLTNQYSLPSNLEPHYYIYYSQTLPSNFEPSTPSPPKSMTPISLPTIGL